MIWRIAGILVWMAAAQAAPREVIAVTDEIQPMAALAGFLETNGYAVAVLDQPKFLARRPAGPPYAMLMYIHNNLDAAAEAALIAYARGGGRLVVLHHGIASAKMRNKQWLPFAGIVLLARDHPAHPWKVAFGDVEVVNLNPGHYVTSHKVNYDRTVAYRPRDEPSVEQQLPGFLLPDTEIYFNQLFSDGRQKTVLLGLKSRVEGALHTDDRAGWYKPVEKGHLFYFQQGHHARDFEHPAFRQIILNSLEWPPEPRPQAPSNRSAFSR